MLRRQTKLNIKPGPLDLGKQMALCLFLLPAILTPAQKCSFRGQVISNFISVAPTVQEFIMELPRGKEGPFVAIIGRIIAPLSFVVYYNKRVYRCVELWHAVDMAVKIILIFRLTVPLDSAAAWQFVMMHFYGLEDRIKCVLPNVLTMHKTIAENSKKY